MGTIDGVKKQRLKIKFVNLLLLALVFSGGFYYLLGVNKLVVKGFELQELKKQSEILSNENREMKNRQVALESYTNLEEKIKALRLVAIDRIDYITAKNDVLAKK